MPMIGRPPPRAVRLLSSYVGRILKKPADLLFTKTGACSFAQRSSGTRGDYKGPEPGFERGGSATPLTELPAYAK